MGILLPTLVVLRKQLNKVKSIVTFARPLVESLLKGVDRRFDGFMDRD